MYMEANKECKQINPEPETLNIHTVGKYIKTLNKQDQNINEWNINKMYVQTESKQIKSKM